MNSPVLCGEGPPKSFSSRSSRAELRPTSRLTHRDDSESAGEREHDEDEDDERGGRQAGSAEPAVPHTATEKCDQQDDDENGQHERRSCKRPASAPTMNSCVWRWS